MIRPTATSLGILAATLLLVAAACTPSSGSLGMPATPPGTLGPSGSAPADELPSAAPSAPPTAVPTGTPPASEAASGSGSPATAASPAPTVSASPATPEPTSPPTMVIRAYFLMNAGNDGGVVPVLRTVPETKGVARAAMEALLAGPSKAERTWDPAITTSIPDGTRLLDVSVQDGVATVALSEEWKGAAASFHGGTATAQVVYTLTQFPTVKLVRVQVAGAAPSAPVGRSDLQYVGLIPAIFVDRPAWGAAMGNPARVAGIANVFEATFRVQVLDAGDGILADEQVMASCGTGCWGTFATDVGYDVAKAQYGTLRVFDLSARDGTPENVLQYKVWLTPAR